MPKREIEIARSIEDAAQMLIALRWAAQAGKCLPQLLDDASLAVIANLRRLAETLPDISPEGDDDVVLGTEDVPAPQGHLPDVVSPGEREDHVFGRGRPALPDAQEQSHAGAFQPEIPDHPMGRILTR